MGAIGKGALVGMALFGTACSAFIAKETLYLESAADHATQKEVRQQLGKPYQTATSKEGIQSGFTMYIMRTLGPTTSGERPGPGAMNMC